MDSGFGIRNSEFGIRDESLENRTTPHALSSFQPHALKHSLRNPHNHLTIQRFHQRAFAVDFEGDF